MKENREGNSKFAQESGSRTPLFCLRNVTTDIGSEKPSHAIKGGFKGKFHSVISGI